LVTNDVAQFAIYQIVAFFVEKKTSVKINNLIVVCWLNILCKHGRIKWRNCHQRNINVTHAYLHVHIPEFIDPENWPANSQYLDPVDFSV